MYFQQLKILIWRNITLKKRGIFATILEIIIPTLIIITIGNKIIYTYIIFVVLNTLILLLLINKKKTFFINCNNKYFSNKFSNKIENNNL